MAWAARLAGLAEWQLFLLIGQSSRRYAGGRKPHGHRRTDVPETSIIADVVAQGARQDTDSTIRAAVQRVRLSLVAKIHRR